MTGKAPYWDSVAQARQKKSSSSLWRLYSDAINIALLSRWLPVNPVNRILKTDLFDESLTDGLGPVLSKGAAKVVGMDISHAILTNAKRKQSRLQMVIADIGHLPFAPGVFNIIVSNSTLDHFKTSKEIISSLKELNQVLRQDGHLFITLDNPANPLIALRNFLPFKLLKWLRICPYYIGATLSARRLRGTLEKLTFSVEEVTTVGHFPRIIVTTLSLVIDKYFSDKFKRNFINVIMAIEHMEKLPTRNFTGHFVAARAVKR